MLFNSYEFLFVFFPVVFAGFFAVAKYGHGLAASWLALASLCFYAYWTPVFLLLLVASICVNFSFGLLIARARASAGKVGPRSFLLFIALAANLLLLGYFKYVDFFSGIANDVSGAGFALQNVVLPLGISFFTFTQIAYLVDVHKGIAREYNFIHYVLFVSYFPHLIAGPVLHHKQMMPQFARPATYRFSAENLSVGLTFFTIGPGLPHSDSIFSNEIAGVK